MGENTITRLFEIKQIKQFDGEENNPLDSRLKY